MAFTALVRSVLVQQSPTANSSAAQRFSFYTIFFLNLTTNTNFILLQTVELETMNSVVFLITVSLLFMFFLAANTSEEEKRRNTTSADQVNNWKLLPLSLALFIIPLYELLIVIMYV